MSTEEPTKQEIMYMIAYITQTIPDVPQQDRKEILRIIRNSGVSDDKIQTKGGGTQIKFRDMNPRTIMNIHTYLTKKITNKMDMLMSLTEETNSS